jgi:CBS domain-containing protein
MDNRPIRHLVLPLDEYVVVAEETTLKEALTALRDSRARLPEGRSPHRAVLVADGEGAIVGRLGQHEFLEALEPRYRALGDVGRLSQAGLGESFVSSVMENYRFWRDDLEVVCRRAGNVRVGDVMVSAEFRIDEGASVTEAIHMFVMARTQSILVTSGGSVVGILRLSDLFAEVAGFVTSSDCR